MEDQTPAIQLNQVCKWYGHVQGVFDITLDIPPGIVGLLGPNGSGKSTLLKLMVGEIRPSQGTIEIFGQPVWNNLELRRQMGYCPDHLQSYYTSLSGRQFLEVLAELSGFSSSEIGDRVNSVLRELDLESVAIRAASSYSKGQRQRLKLAQALMGDPKILFLDEPLQNFDPLVRASVIQILKNRAAKGTHIVVSSHILHEIEAITNQVVVLKEGKVIAYGQVSDIRELLQQVPRRMLIKLDRPRQLARLLSEREYIESISFTPDANSLTITLAQREKLLADLPELILENNLVIREIVGVDESLEEVFDLLTHRRLRKNRA